MRWQQQEIDGQWKISMPRIIEVGGFMTSAEQKAYKAKQLRYKKPIVKDLNIDTITSELWDMASASSAGILDSVRRCVIRWKNIWII